VRGVLILFNHAITTWFWIRIWNVIRKIHIDFWSPNSYPEAPKQQLRAQMAISKIVCLSARRKLSCDRSFPRYSLQNINPEPPWWHGKIRVVSQLLLYTRNWSDLLKISNRREFKSTGMVERHITGHAPVGLVRQDSEICPCCFFDADGVRSLPMTVYNIVHIVDGCSRFVL
jgi:hypothetical protein